MHKQQSQTRSHETWQSCIDLTSDLELRRSLQKSGEIFVVHSDLASVHVVDQSLQLFGGDAREDDEGVHLRHCAEHFLKDFAGKKKKITYNTHNSETWGTVT